MSDDLLLAAATARDRIFADALTMLIGLAAETNPDVLRTALEKVFDLRAVEDTAQRAIKVCTQAQEQANNVHHVVSDMEGRYEDLQERMDRLAEGLRQAETQLKQLKATNGTIKRTGSDSTTDGSARAGNEWGD